MINTIDDIKEISSLEHLTEKPTVVLWTAKWVPVLSKGKTLIEPMLESHEFHIINVDLNPMLADRYGIVVLPTFALYSAGKEKARTTGSLTLDEIEKFIKRAERKK